MKTRPFLALTALNLGLVSFLWLRPVRPLQPAETITPRPAFSTALAATAGSGGSLRPLPAAPRTATAPAPVGGSGFHWRQVESEDYPTYIANLRRIGCPANTIRDLIVADVRALYDAHRAAVQPVRAVEFWQKDYEPGPLTDASVKRLLQLAREEQAVLTQLLDGFWPLRSVEETTAGTTAGNLRLDGMLAAKREALLAWQQRFETQERAILELAGNRDLTADETARLRALDSAREAELTRLLTPTEREEFALRNSGAAAKLRERMVGFAVSEDEFRSLFRLQQEHERTVERLAQAGDNAGIKTQTAAFSAAAARLLGSERSEWYALTGDADFQELHELGQRHSLALEPLTQAFSLHRAAAEQLGGLADSDELTDAQRQALSQRIARQLDQRLLTLLGEDAFRAYLRSELRASL